MLALRDLEYRITLEVLDVERRIRAGSADDRSIADNRPIAAAVDRGDRFPAHTGRERDARRINERRRCVRIPTASRSVPLRPSVSFIRIDRRIDLGPEQSVRRIDLGLHLLGLKRPIPRRPVALVPNALPDAVADLP